MRATAGCEVWWADVAAIGPPHRELLDARERRRLSQFRRPADRDRSLLGAVLLRLVIARRHRCQAADVAVDRSCPRCGKPHGRPSLPDIPGLHVSVSHSGNLAAVAVTAAGQVGVDVEQVTDLDIGELAGSVLTVAEAAQVADARALLRLWTRKEAVLKATGDGLAAPMTGVRVSGPDQPPRLLGYAGRPDLAAQLHDLHPAGGYLASVAVLAAEPVPVSEHDAAALLASC